MATPLLDLRTPRGLHIDPPVIRHRFRNSAGVLTKAIVRILGNCHLRCRHRFYGLGSVGASHVRIRFRSSGSSGLFGDNNVHCCANRREDFELDCDDVGRESQIHSANDVLGIARVDVYYRRPIGCYALSGASRHPTN